MTFACIVAVIPAKMGMAPVNPLARPFVIFLIFLIFLTDFPP